MSVLVVHVRCRRRLADGQALLAEWGVCELSPSDRLPCGGLVPSKPWPPGSCRRRHDPCPLLRPDALSLALFHLWVR